MGVYIWNKLPSEYQEVEYIQSSGTQYIDTGLTVSGNVKADYEYTPTSSSPSAPVFIDTDWRNNGFGSGNTYIYYGGNTSNNEGYTVGRLAQNVKAHDIVAKSGCSRTLNGTTVSYTPSSSYPSPSGTLKLFAGQRAGSIISYNVSKLYSFKRYDSGVLTQDLIPCYRKSDNVIGLYDLVNNQFYTNSGSGTFSKGSDVNTYRESSLKNAYIGEVYEYSYDFRNKSSTILTNDGWVLVSGSPTFNANGINGKCKYKNTSLGEGKLANARKITITLVGTPYQSNGIGCGIAVEIPVSGMTGKTGNYMQANKEETNIYGTNYGDTSKSWSGKQTLITVVDLEAKTWVTTISAGYSWNGTLSDSEVANIRGNSKMINYSGGASCVGESISIIIE